MNNRDFGIRGEECAVNFLKENGYKILSRNFKTKLGEIDIIARDKDTYCFVEVKTRKTDSFGLPKEAVSKHKQRQISKAALCYIKENRLFEKKARFDVVSLLYQNGSPKPDLIKDAFELSEQFTY